MQLIGSTDYGETPALGRQRRRKAIDNAMASQMTPGLPAASPTPTAPIAPAMPDVPAAAPTLGAPAAPAAPQQPMFGSALRSAPARTFGSAAGGALMGGAVGGIPGALAGGLAGAVLQYAQRGKPSQQASNAMANGWDGFSQEGPMPLAEQKVQAQAPQHGIDYDGMVGDRLTASPLGGYGRSPNMTGYNGGVSANLDTMSGAQPMSQGADFDGFLRKLFG